MRRTRFFSETANWFLPFYPDHGDFAGIIDGGGAVLAQQLADIPFLCDSDKYAMMMSIVNAPGSRQAALLGTLTENYRRMADSNPQGFAEALGIKADTRTRRRMAANNYIKNLYRFLFQADCAGGFFNPFSKGVSPVGIRFFSDVYAPEKENIAATAEFFFRLGLYRDYLEAFAAMGDDPALPFIQKAGFCAEKLGDHDAAADFYSRALVPASANLWTLRRLASVLRRSGRAAEALPYYRKLLEISPDDEQGLRAFGFALLDSGDNAGAVEAFRHLDYSTGGEKASSRRPLAWALFLAREFDEAEEVYAGILADAPVANDYLNYGHLLAAKGDFAGALKAYLHSASEGALDADGIIGAIRADSEALLTAGVDPYAVNTLCDAIAFGVGD